MTLQEDAEKLQEAWRDLLYECARPLGIIAFIKHIPFLRLHDWVQDREDRAVSEQEDA